MNQEQSAVAYINPLSSEPHSESFPETSTDQIDAIILKAQAAQKIWEAIPLKERQKRLVSFAKKVVKNRTQGASIISKETGRPFSVTQLTELNNTVSYANDAITISNEALKSKKLPLSPLDFPKKRGMIDAVPRGVIGIISPWNYPINNLLKSIFPALLSGNAIIIKPSEYTPKSTTWLLDLLRTEISQEDVSLHALIGQVNGGAKAGKDLVNGAIDAVVFTGSVSAGRAVGSAAASRLIPSSLELGGKDSAIVLKDANLDRTALGIAQWSLFNSGQDCSSIERVYVDASIADDFIDRLQKVVAKYRVCSTAGEQSELGPLQNAAQLQQVSDHVRQAIDLGARCVLGGNPTGKGFGFEPTILDECTQEMMIMSEETFGPVIAISRFTNEDQAINLANDSKYGLNGSIWTTDIARGEQLAKQLEVGIALVNQHSMTGTMAHAPWTGVKQTGYGVAASEWSYGIFTRRRTTLIDANKDPDPFWFPADEGFEHFIDLVAQRNLSGGLGVTLKLARSLSKRIKAIKNLLN